MVSLNTFLSSILMLCWIVNVIEIILHHLVKDIFWVEEILLINVLLFSSSVRYNTTYGYRSMNSLLKLLRHQMSDFEDF